MLAGYNTNGFAHHQISDTLLILAELGYRSIGLTFDFNSLNPYDASARSQAKELGKLARDLNLKLVVETGARFLLDPRRKHQPALLSRQPLERKKRSDFLLLCAEIGLELGSDILSFWSGKPDFSASEETYFQLIAEQVQFLCGQIQQTKMKVAFEPEPGMFIDTMAKFSRLFSTVNQPNFGLTLDIGHLECMQEMPIINHLTEWQKVIWNIHLEDMKPKVHDHLLPGEGSVDFQMVFNGLREIGYAGGVHWELSRHSHDAVETARKCRQFMQGYGC